MILLIFIVMVMERVEGRGLETAPLEPIKAQVRGHKNNFNLYMVTSYKYIISKVDGFERLIGFDQYGFGS